MDETRHTTSTLKADEDKAVLVATNIFWAKN